MAVTPLFLYGTLRHHALLETVLGRDVAAEDMVPAFLADASATWVKDQPFPMIRLGTTEQAPGIVLQGLSQQDIARLNFYEGGFGYALVEVETSAGGAKVYLPGPEVGPPGEPFDLNAWANDWADLSIEAAQEVMRHFGHRSATEVAAMFPAIRTRASARLRARQTKRQGFDGRVEIESRALPYAKFFALEDIALRAETFDGQMSNTLQRAVFLGMDAAIVLPYDPVRDRVMLVEQIRLGPIGRGDPDAWQLEPIAGHVDPGETPEQAARREAREEAGLTLTRLLPVANAYPSPGASSEFYYIYVGLCDLPDGSEGVAGMVSEGENIRSHLMSFDDLMARVDSQKLTVAPLVLAALWLARHRDGLRR